MMYNNGAILLLWGAMLIVVCVFVIYIALGLKKLQEGAKRLAEGDLSYQIDKNGLRWDLARHADDLNSICLLYTSYYLEQYQRNGAAA